MSIRRKIKTLAIVGAVGAAAAYLFDPTNGRLRRERLTRAVERRRDDVRHAAHSVERAAEAITSGDETLDDAAAPGDPSGSTPADEDGPVDQEALEPPDVAGVTDTPPVST